MTTPTATSTITCPWCGTGYTHFQPNCKNCGGSLPLPPCEPRAQDEFGSEVTTPPPAPRNVPRNSVWRVLGADGWAITAGVFALLGIIFGVVGLGLTLPIVTAFVGLPFAGLGALFLLAGVPLLVWRYHSAEQLIEVLRQGQPALGQIVNIQANYHVRVNGRHPWRIAYRFAVDGRSQEGQVTTLGRPAFRLQPGRPVYVLYMPADPTRSALYPYPYGYYEV